MTRKLFVARSATLTLPMLLCLRTLVREVARYGWTMSTAWVMKVRTSNGAERGELRYITMALGGQFAMIPGISMTRKSCVVRSVFLTRQMLQCLRTLVIAGLSHFQIMNLLDR